MNYLMHILVLICIYSMLGQSLNFLVGYGGLLSLAQGAFYGIGAYVFALVLLKSGVTYPVAIPVCLAAAGIIGTSVALLCLRVRGDFFALCTLGVQMILLAFVINAVSVTNGPFGLSGIPRPTVFGLRLDSPPSFFIGVLITTSIVLLTLFRVSRSPFCRALKAVRDDEIAGIALGKNPLFLRTVAFVIAASVAGLAGALYAGYVSYIDPTSFTVEESIFILTLVVVGGAGTFRGPILGAVLLVLFPEALRFLRVPDAIAPNIRQIAYGLLLVLMMRFRPQGIVGDYAFD